MPRPPLSSLKMSIPWEKVTFECFSSWSRGCKVHICVSTSCKAFSVWSSQSPALSWTTNDKRSNTELSKVHLCWRLSRGLLLLTLSESSVQVVSLVSSALQGLSLFSSVSSASQRGSIQVWISLLCLPLSKHCCRNLFVSRRVSESSHISGGGADVDSSGHFSNAPSANTKQTYYSANMFVSPYIY